MSHDQGFVHVNCQALGRELFLGLFRHQRALYEASLEVSQQVCSNRGQSHKTVMMLLVKVAGAQCGWWEKDRERGEGGQVSQDKLGTQQLLTCTNLLMIFLTVFASVKPPVKILS